MRADLLAEIILIGTPILTVVLALMVAFMSYVMYQQVKLTQECFRRIEEAFRVLHSIEMKYLMEQQGSSRQYSGEDTNGCGEKEEKRNYSEGDNRG